MNIRKKINFIFLLAIVIAISTEFYLGTIGKLRFRAEMEQKSQKATSDVIKKRNLYKKIYSNSFTDVRTVDRLLWASIEKYSIQVPDNVISLEFNPKLDSRGVVKFAGIGGYCEVEIGPYAFRSEGLLGSTLAHELEGHCNQNHLYIALLDSLSFFWAVPLGTGLAEQEAYRIEINGRERFGLSDDENEVIEYFLDDYAPSFKKSNVLEYSEREQKR